MKKNLLFLLLFVFATTAMYAQSRDIVVVMEEGFEGLAFEEVPAGWTQIEEDPTSDRIWGAKEYSFSMTVYPHSGTMLMDYWAGDITKLVTPALDLSDSDGANMNFFYSLNNAGFPPVNQLKVYYKNSFDSEWVELGYYTQEVIWAEVTLDLPELSDDYYIAFEGLCLNSFNDGIQIDDITITKNTVTSINDVEANVSIYPNPSNGVFTIENLVSFEITDLSGRLIKKLDNQHQLSNYTVDISNQPTGIYFIMVNTQSGVYSKKIVVE